MKKLTLLLAALLLVAAACGDDDATTTTSAPATTTTTAGDDSADTTAPADDESTTLAPTTTGTTPIPATTAPYVSNTLTDAVADCLAGDDVACDVAYLISDLGSPEEEIGDTCGGRGLPADQMFCSGYDIGSTANIVGDDPLLDELWNLCSDGSDEACLALYEWSPAGSSYETYAEAVLFPGGDDGGGNALDLGDLPPIDVAGMNSCAALADGAIVLIQALIDIIDSVSLDDMELITGQEDIFIQAEDIGMAMDDQAEALDCTDAEIEALILDRVDQLTAEGFFGQLLIDGIREDGAFDFGG